MPPIDPPPPVPPQKPNVIKIIWEWLKKLIGLKPLE